jgi:hypothetical protein
MYKKLLSNKYDIHKTNKFWFKYAKQYNLFGGAEERKPEKPIPVQKHRRKELEKIKTDPEGLFPETIISEDEKRRIKLQFLSEKILGKRMFHGSPLSSLIMETGLGTLKIPYFEDIWETYYDDLIYLTTNLDLAKKYSKGYNNETILPQERVKEFIEKVEQLKDSPPFENTLDNLNWSIEYKKAFKKFFTSRIDSELYEKIKNLPSNQKGILSIRPDLSQIAPDEDLFAILTLYKEDELSWSNLDFVPPWMQKEANKLGIDPGFLAEYIILTIDELINTIIECINEDTKNNISIDIDKLKEYGPIEKLCIVLRRWALFVITWIRLRKDSFMINEHMEEEIAKYYSIISMEMDERYANSFSMGIIDEYDIVASYISKKIMMALEDDPLLRAACGILSLVIKGSAAFPSIPKDKFEEHGVQKIGLEEIFLQPEED